MLLNRPEETILTEPSTYQDLTFEKLKFFYSSHELPLPEETFEKNLVLRNEEGKYNLLAQLLSDDSHFPLRVTIFQGKTRDTKLLSVQEFGCTCLLYTLTDLLHYGEILNLPQADETDRIVERKEVPLYNKEAFREAVINAILHNKWVSGHAPMISIFSDHIEILSRGTLARAQTKEGFFSGESVPVNPKLSEIFLQLHISEKSGRGVPIIVHAYGKDAFTFGEESIAVNIPLHWISKENEQDSSKESTSVDQNLQKKIALDFLTADSSSQYLSDLQIKILRAIQHNPSIHYVDLCKLLNVNRATIARNISILKEKGFLKRVGSNKTGYWEILDPD